MVARAHRSRLSMSSSSAAARREAVSIVASASAAKPGSRSMSLRAAEAWMITTTGRAPRRRGSRGRSGCVRWRGRRRAPGAAVARRRTPEQRRPEPRQEPPGEQRAEDRRRRRGRPPAAGQRDQSEHGGHDESAGEHVQEPAQGPAALRPAGRDVWRPVRELDSEQALRASGPSTSACSRSQSGLTGGGDL